MFHPLSASSPPLFSLKADNVLSVVLMLIFREVQFID